MDGEFYLNYATRLFAGDSVGPDGTVIDGIRIASAIPAPSGAAMLAVFGRSARSRRRPSSMNSRQ
jgi:hypothetical protein